MTTPAFIVVIPARFQSSRLPGKMLLDIAGKPMILHVVERARQSLASAVYVATDDDRIAAHAREIGAEPVMTDPDLPSGTDRCRRPTNGSHTRLHSSAKPTPRRHPKTCSRPNRARPQRERASHRGRVFGVSPMAREFFESAQPATVPLA
jgi:hypothetical protein